jgi:hypothetical protein
MAQITEIPELRPPVHALRAYDAIHLASAGTLREKIAVPVSFASWDWQLYIAAGREGLNPVHIRQR